MVELRKEQEQIEQETEEAVGRAVMEKMMADKQFSSIPLGTAQDIARAAATTARRQIAVAFQHSK